MGYGVRGLDFMLDRGPLPFLNEKRTRAKCNLKDPLIIIQGMGEQVEGKQRQEGHIRFPRAAGNKSPQTRGDVKAGLGGECSGSKHPSSQLQGQGQHQGVGRAKLPLMAHRR